MLEEIKKRHLQDEVDMNKISKGQVHADRGILLTKLEFAQRHRDEWEKLAIESGNLYKTEQEKNKALAEALEQIQYDVVKCNYGSVKLVADVALTTYKGEKTDG